MAQKATAVLLAVLLAVAMMGQGDCATDPGGGGEGDTALEDRSGGDDKKKQRRTFRTRRFSGSGSSNIGSFTLPSTGVLSWTHQPSIPEASFFAISDSDFKINVNSQARRGRSVLEAGRYRSVDVSAEGRWTITIRPR